MKLSLRHATAALLLLAACKGAEEKAPPPQVVAAERRSIVIDAQATGVVEPINVVEVKSKASGMITRMPVETGTSVKPGDLLVQVDTRDVQNQYDQAMADLRSAEARLQVSQAQKRRSDEMFKSRVITAQENEAAALDYANAEAQIVRARTSLDLAKQRLEDATVTAPVTGTIIEKTVSLGQVIVSATGSVSGGTTLVKMADLGRVRIRALFNETDIGQIGSGQQATVVVDAYPDRRFQGTVEKIEPQAVVQQGVTLFPVLVTLSNLEGLLKPGMNGEVSVLVEERPNVLAVPNEAVRNTREGAAVAPMLGLNPDSVTDAVRVQFASLRGGRGMGGMGGGETGGAAPPATAPATTPGGARQGAGTPTLAMQGSAGEGGNRGGANTSGGQTGGGQLPDVTDAQCTGIRSALAKGGAQEKLDALMQRARSGEMDFSAVREESGKIYAAAGVDARIAFACRRRERMASGGGMGGPAGGADGARGASREGAPGAPGAPGGAMRSARDNAGPGGGAGTASPQPWGSAAPGASRRVRQRPGIVFVQNGASWEPRVVMLGASNFDYTEVVSGLKEGEKVALLASLALQAQRQQQNERFRQGMGGGVPGMSQNQGGAGGRGGAGGGGAAGGAPRGGAGGGR